MVVEDILANGFVLAIVEMVKTQSMKTVTHNLVQNGPSGVNQQRVMLQVAKFQVWVFALKIKIEFFSECIVEFQ